MKGSMRYLQWSENIRSREIRISYQEEWFSKLQEAHVDLVLLPGLIIEVTAAAMGMQDQRTCTCGA